jgi:enoyl-[acyl-carrier protein] reductase II
MNRITTLFTIRYPIIQAGMVWAAGWELCAAVSKAGALGLIGASSMKPDILQLHIQKVKAALQNSEPFGVNISLQRGDADELVQACLDEGVKIFFTSAGNPGRFAPILKERGAIVVHVVPSAILAQKAEARGVDAVVCEGTEAGGHDGVDEIPTFVLVPQVVDTVKIPVIAAGGIVDGRGIAAAMALGAEGVQIGTRFAATVESSAHPRYKQAVLEAADTGTVFTMRRIGPVRMLRNPFAQRCAEAEARGASEEEQRALRGEHRERMGIFEGEWEEGMLEAGMGAGLIRDLPTAGDLVTRLIREYNDTAARLNANVNTLK